MKGMYPCGAPLPEDAPQASGTGPSAGETFNPEGARRRMGIGRADFGRIFEYIWCEVSERRSLLDDAFRAGDVKRVALQAHTIKSSAATIGAEALSRTAEAVELAAGAGNMEALAKAMDAFHVAKETLCKLVGMG